MNNWHKTNSSLLEPFFEAQGVDILPTILWLRRDEPRPQIPPILKFVVFLYLESYSRESFRAKVMEAGEWMSAMGEEI